MTLLSREYSHEFFIMISFSSSAVAHLCVATISWGYRHFPGFIDGISTFIITLVCASTYLIRYTFWPRQTFVTFLMCVWSIRLGLYLMRRAKYVDKLPPSDGELWPARTLWTTFICIPCIAVNVLDKAQLTMHTITFIGVIMASTGLAIEWIADRQKERWHRSHPRRPGPKDVEAPCCTTGLWAYSRHPNYLGSIMLHVGCWLAVFEVVPAWTVIAPTFVVLTICLFPGGMRTLETDKQIDYFGYPMFHAYIDKTPLLFPFVK